jgi:hypothetical protein
MNCAVRLIRILLWHLHHHYDTIPKLGVRIALDLERSVTTMTLQDGFEIGVFVGWAGSICSMLSVARHSSSDFESVGRSRGQWFWINALGLIPYLGIITTIIYVVSAWRLLPDKPKPVRQARRPAGPNSAGLGAQSSYPMKPRASTMSPPKPPPPRVKIPCGHCGTGRWIRGSTGSLIPCTACGGKGYIEGG